MLFEQRFIDRFWHRVDVRGPDDCWEWTRGKAGNEYGQLSLGYHPIKTHVFSFVLHFGPVPAGLWVLHTCDNRRCVNPRHLYAGTPAQNMQDCSRRGRVVVPGYKGSEHPCAKLTEEDIPDIRASGLSQRALGRVYGVDQALIHLVKARKIWKHVA